MDDTVVYLKPSRFRSRNWTNDEVAAFYRVLHILQQSGINVEMDQGVTDEGDPWLAFCTDSDCEIFAHFALINGEYVVEAPVLNMEMKAATFSGLVERFLQLFPAVPAAQQGARNGKLQIHPSALLTALITTLFMLTKMTQEAEASTYTADDAASFDVQMPQASDFASLVGEVFYPAHNAAKEHARHDSAAIKKIKELRSTSGIEMRADFIVNSIAMASIVMPIVDKNLYITSHNSKVDLASSTNGVVKTDQLVLQNTDHDPLAISREVDIVARDSYTLMGRAHDISGTISYGSKFAELPAFDPQNGNLIDGISDFTDLLASFAIEDPMVLPQAMVVEQLEPAAEEAAQNGSPEEVVTLIEENEVATSIVEPKETTIDEPQETLVVEPPEAAADEPSLSPLLLEIFGSGADLSPLLVTQSEQTDAAVAITEQKLHAHQPSDPVITEITENIPAATSENEPDIVAVETDPDVAAAQGFSDNGQAPEITLTVSFDWGQLDPFDVILSFIHLGDDVVIYQSPTHTYLIEGDFINAAPEDITIEEFHFDDDTTVYLVGVQDTFQEMATALF